MSGQLVSLAPAALPDHTHNGQERVTNYTTDNETMERIMKPWSCHHLQGGLSSVQSWSISLSYPISSNLACRACRGMQGEKNGVFKKIEQTTSRQGLVVCTPTSRTGRDAPAIFGPSAGPSGCIQPTVASLLRIRTRCVVHWLVIFSTYDNQATPLKLQLASCRKL